MAETQTLNFGPEWLRALSGGGGSGGGGSSNAVASPPLSPALPKYKLADYRYGREEMLALYVKDNKIPIDLHDKEFLPILQEEPLPPLALVSFTEEEQRNFSMSVNSAAVLRLTGRGGGPIAGAPRGRSTSRGRGRGRGDGGFYQRSFDDVEGFGRGGREMHRSQSWEERGDRRFEKPGRKDPDAAPGHFQINHIRGNYEDGGTGLPRKHDFTRSESENWRTSRDDQNDGPRSAGWREHPDQRRRFPFDAREDERGYRRPRSGSGSLEDERDSLPEWCLEDADEEAGTFDSSGAFLSLKKASKEPILEEAELDFKPLEECEEGVEEEDSLPKETKETETEAKREADRKELARASEEAPSVAPPVSEPQAPTQSLSPNQPSRTEEPERPAERQLPLELPPEPCKVPLHVPMSNSMLESLPMTHISTTLAEVSAPSPTIQLPQQKPIEVPVAMNNPLPFPSSIMDPIGRPTTVPHDTDEDEGLKHFEQEAEKMVAYLQDSGVDDDRLAAKTSEKPKPSGLPLTHEAALKWFYKDPQGEIQGPFSNQEMTEWFQAGYFTVSLLVKRGCDEIFQPLGEIMKIWGRVPFTPGPAPPPLQADGDQERLKRQQELTALNLYQLQQLQYQYLLRQQYAQALAQQKAAALSSAPLHQQQQHQQQINLLLQQYQALKIRASESLLPPVTRSLSVPDSGSVWEMQNPSSQASCTPNLQQAAPSSAWDGSSSVWDLPIDSMAQAPTIEQMQQLEKSKSAKLELERREAEMRAKREEEERKRLEEALRARQEEERKRLEEEELARQKQEEALRRQREQEEAQRRQKEEEERLAQEEALRRLEERRREEEERKKREEFLRKQEEERRKQEELEALRRREEEKRAEEEAAAAAAAAALAQQQEEQKRREQEAQRQQELQRQRQQQQEALRRLQQQQQQQQQLAQMKLPSSSKWGQQSANTINQTQNALSLAEIQKLEEERERQAREEQRRQQQELLKLQQQQALQQAQQPNAKLSGWGNVAKQPVVTKSLLEIQREEAQQMKQRKDQQHQQQPQPQHHPIVTQQTRTQNRTTSLSNSVWGSVNTSACTNWGSDSSSIWGDTHNSNMGFWDEAVKEAVQQPPPTRKGNTQKNNKGNANLSNSLSGRANKKVEEEEKLLKLFQGVNKSQQDTFMQWCEQTLHTLNTANNLDVPTFASFLKEVDSPYEVHDYVRAYLGDTPEAKDFAKQFLERRAKQNANQQKQAPQNQQQTLKQQQDSVWGGTGSSSLYQSNHTSGQQQRFETVTSGKKKKKQKMVRADPSLLGFSVNASSERLNMGEIETLEDF
ncbi:GRB10-interacting GYF protein 2 isoform X3 [Amphiprion ocellaris]|uniref:GRB10-interacting GYF protein 2 isoform X3 n=1 Tax=Amphiprion ocellaris TaxID=80972 RepID=UPI000C3055D6|nr:GRB10-interacting GYF protein 2 isoform X3 [Amphiprion ocellaris]